jgi:cyclic pyranopterin phosphate synthase
VELKTALRTGISMAELRDRVPTLLLLKPEINDKGRNSGTAVAAYSRTMSQIGG